MPNRRRLGRPRLSRCIKSKIPVKFFKPKGVPLSTLEEVVLTVEEVEALRLKNVEGYDQLDCAKKMKTSQSTFQRILSSAYKKVSEALVLGKSIKIIDK